MEAELLKALPNLGIGIASVYILYLVFRVAIDAINQRDKSFKEYVEANNHKSVEVMTECRDSIRAATEGMKIHNDSHRQMMDDQKRLIDLVMDKRR